MIHNITVLDNAKCVGCFACKNICPLNCIEKEIDERGFEYPKVCESKCVECGKCVGVCPALNKKKTESENVFLAAQAVDKSQRLKSSSGGIFGVIAERLLSKGYVVYGAALTANHRVEHIRVTDDVSAICGSKYVQSDLDGVFGNIKNDIDEGNKILFSGTPCQVAAIKQYIEKTAPSKTENFIFVDLICHGVGSPGIWDDYIKGLEKNGNIENISFRDKTTGWHNSSFSFVCDGKKELLTHTQCPYMNAYGSNLCIRNACFDCDFKGFDRVSDVTLGDLWDKDIENLKGFGNDDTGISTVILHSSKALSLLEGLRDEGFVVFEEYDSNKIIEYNKCAIASVQRSKKQDKFDSLISKGYSFDNAVRFALKRSFFEKCIDKIKFEIKKIKNRGN